jgi:hypothetical protein
VSFGLHQAQQGTVKGMVFQDNNRNGSADAGEPGIPNMWVGVTPDAGVNVAGYTYTDASGNFSINVPSLASPAAPYYILTVVKDGFFPTTTTSIGPFYINGGQTINNNNFGEIGYQIISLTASRVLSLTSTDMIEKDWNGNQTQNARGDNDLILGADATGSDQISCWYNNYNGSPLFNTTADQNRTAPQSVLALAADTLDNSASFRNRPDLVTGTKYTGSFNFFAWITQSSGGNEGTPPATPSKSYKTNDNGDVQSVVTYDCAGGTMPDIIVGTKSPTANQGTFEVWQNNDLAAMDFTRVEIYPPAGVIPGNSLGEVTAMVLADFDGDGKKDLVVGTRTGNYSGQVMFFKFVNKTTGTRFVYQTKITLATDAVTSLACTDIDGDGKIDVAVGTQTGLTTGHLLQVGNKTSILWAFAIDRTVDAPGIVMSLATSDLGGGIYKDLAVGYRADAATFVGGIRVYYLDALKIPTTGTDPSAGAVTNMVPAVTSANFNYGVKPSLPALPYLPDLATGVKISATTGALVVYIR